MMAKLDYRWHLRQVMAARGMFATTDLIEPLAERGIRLSSSQVYRLVVERPERLSLKVLMALLDILDTTTDELIEPVAAEPAKQTRAASGGGAVGAVGVGDLRPKTCASHPARLVTAAPGAPEALVDPIGTVVALVTTIDPTLDQDDVHGVVERVGGGRTKLRRLATTLARDASVLTNGRSPAPRVVGDLLLALRAAGASRISPPWCTSCGRKLSAMQLRGQHWYCSPCYTRPQPCASCGQDRQVTFRDRRGRPRCSQCPDHDARDPRQVMVRLIVAIDPGSATRTRRPLRTAPGVPPGRRGADACAAGTVPHSPDL